MNVIVMFRLSSPNIGSTSAISYFLKNLSSFYSPIAPANIQKALYVNSSLRIWQITDSGLVIEFARDIIHKEDVPVSLILNFISTAKDLKHTKFVVLSIFPQRSKFDPIVKGDQLSFMTIPKFLKLSPYKNSVSSQHQGPYPVSKLVSAIMRFDN